MFRLKLIVFLLLGGSLFAQKLHHQMISTQGANVKLQNGMRVSQSIGQQSTIGNHISSTLIMGQGFIQSATRRSNGAPVLSTIATIVYPNPFTDVLNFKFSSPVEGNIKVSIFDVRGRLVFTEDAKANQNILTIDDLYFSEGNYFVKLEANNLIYSSQIIKTK